MAWRGIATRYDKTPGSYHAGLHLRSEPGQDPRHGDSIDPLWNLFDLTPEGRGTDWYPQLSYL